ncbi:MAG: FAD-dependent oxidoreductase [Candidatus Moranbacteria bacterium]|nr:FAD-dependent oxidoreductase [Candidatus Moranbacteria bacterium]
MNEYTIKLKKKQKVAEETWMFTFQKPADLKFQAGQYAMLEIIEERFTDDRPKFRAMSIASAPQDNHLDFIMRESESAFKKNITTLEIGKEIKIKAPIGHFSLPEDKNKKIVFLTAGVGITPIRSILREEELKKSERKITLFYSNRNVESAALYKEMEKFKLKNYKCVNTMTRKCTNWNGEYGRINDEMISKYLDEVENSLYYVVGTKKFIEAMRKTLTEMKVEKENIIFDNFG